MQVDQDARGRPLPHCARAEADRRYDSGPGVIMNDSSEHHRQWSISFGVNDADAVDRLLRSLPNWFGIEASNRAYVESARTLPTYFARPASGAADSDLPVGVLLA